ncbi:MAG: serine hydroxymethyltransferase [Candidatus Abyssobacteria bacterium SURF_5]|uniref:Serine hydroxymethyltransferase n=1 Tax=Abyssobacteria bacterium (strain SURF_5) TaxID=2093360 RepID=A0A3A4P054_ABYX5|nr:MAG: serine hydroxymethyltransferase [Candidatus Abyssubacteria bacterium SURF_5]
MRPTDRKETALGVVYEKVSALAKTDPEIAKAIECEYERQRTKLQLIPSENYASSAVLEAQGSVMTNKYAEGYPAHRYYRGCENMDVVEALAIDRAKKLFGAEHANVQPHSGSQANMAVYFSMLRQGDMLMGMRLSHGGHLTHGAPASFSGRFFQIESYGVDPKTEVLDYDAVRRHALRCKPKMIVVGASAYPRNIDFAAFGEIAREVGAYLMADIAHIAGLIAGGVHPSPFPHADFVTVTTHKTLRGPRGGLILCKSKYAHEIDKMVFPGIQGGPLMHVIAAKAVSLKEAMTGEFAEYQRQIVLNARRLARELSERGFRLVSDGTDTHLMLVDLTNRSITGKEAAEVLDQAGITVNMNTIPYDKLGPAVTSGIRPGTPAVTTRGMGEAEMVLIAQFIDDALNARKDVKRLAQIREKVRELCERFPMPNGL